MEFDAAAWIAVSKSYDVEDLMKKMAKDFGLRIDIVNMENRSLIEMMHRYLQGKRYIVIMDDVWGVDVWFKVRHVFLLIVSLDSLSHQEYMKWHYWQLEIL